MSNSDQPKKKPKRPRPGDRRIVSIEEWSVERAHDSAEYLRRRGPCPKWKPRD